MIGYDHDTAMCHAAHQRAAVKVTDTRDGSTFAGILTAWRPHRRHTGREGRVSEDYRRHEARILVNGFNRTYRLNRFDVELQP